jgi:hypothetical protein
MRLRAQSRNIGIIAQAQTPIIQMLSEVRTAVLTKKGIDSHGSTTRSLPSSIPQVYMENNENCCSWPDCPSNLLASNVIMRWVTYHLPIGKIRVSYGWKSNESDHLPGDNITTVAGKWEFHPESWLSYKGFITNAMGIIQSTTQLIRPTILPTLSTTVALSQDHPVWNCIYRGDVVEFRQLLSAGSFGLNDVHSNGTTLLHYVSIFITLSCLPELIPRAQACQVFDNKIHRPGISDIIPLILSANPECNTLDYDGL